MNSTELGFVVSANHRCYRRCCPVSASNRPGLWRSGLFRALQGLDACLLEIGPPLQVVAGCHHCHRKVCLRMADGPDQLAAHLCDGREQMFD